MWRFKQFIPKEHNGLEGRIVDIGHVKVHVRNILAEGGFSCVYVATDSMQPSKNYALKHMICNDEESLDLAKKEISVLKLLKGHPNVINLNGTAIFDMGRTKEVLLLMEFCEKSLVTVLENRGGGYFDEKQILLIFRDVCNGVFAMHCQSPPIAHRDLKAENVLLGADGAWKLCDFGSTSTNHKCFSRPEEMGIEEDVIRKHTTPAYRAPEMWDLYRREIISEKVDIWALGCLLYRICYLKSAFDGESKLQILNGNYRIPELPNYSSSLKDLIKDMLQSSPDARPDITQVWFRVNLQLPEDLQKQMPNNVATNENHLGTANLQKEGISKKSSMVPRRSPPPPPSQKEHSILPQCSSKTEDNKAPVGAFWSTQHAFDFQFDEDSGPKQAPQGRTKVNPPPAAHSVQQASIKVNDSPGEDFEIRFDKDGGFEEISGSKSNSKIEFSDKAFNAFVADFDHSKVNASTTSGLEAKVERLKEQLKEANLEKAEITSKYEKLSAICRSQRQEIQDLKQALAAAKPKSDGCREQSSPPEREKIEGSVKELSDSILSSPSPSSNTNQWQPFSEPTARSARPRSVRTINGHNSISRNSNSPSSLDSWGFDPDKFVAAPTSSPQVSTTATRLSDSGGVRQAKPLGNQPTGWAGF